MAQVEFKQVGKSFGTVEVISGLNLAIKNGEFLVLVGPSGCGKTTTLRMLAGLEEVSQGAVTIDDTDVTHLRPGLRDCAMVFQNYALYPHMTVRGNIAYGMKVRKVAQSEIDSRVDEASELLGLNPYLDRKPRNLSGGQRQRVAIGRAIVRHPKVFLFDEPLSNLDAKLRVEMRSEIRQLQRRLGSTVVYVTHDQVEAMTMADRVVVMNEGRIEQVASPIELYEKPNSLFVAGFIGTPSMNLLDATINGDAVQVGSAKLPLPKSVADRLPAATQSIKLGIRPEHFRESRCQGEISLSPNAIEPLGPHTIIIGPYEGVRVSAQIGAHDPAEIGKPITVPVDMEQAHFFDAKTGLRI